MKIFSADIPCLCTTMSKLFKKTGTQRKPNQVTTQTGLIPVEELGHARAVYGTAHLPAALPGARILT